jgi:hypothetical protein
VGGKYSLNHWMVTLALSSVDKKKSKKTVHLEHDPGPGQANNRSKHRNFFFPFENEANHCC